MNDDDRIIILLIDDNPGNLNDKVVVAGKTLTMPRVISAKFGRYFEVIWIATAAESRAFLDDFKKVALRAPLLLGEVRVVPDVLLFDYALSDKTQPVVARRQLGDVFEFVSPLARLERAMKKLRLAPSPLPTDVPVPIKPPTATIADAKVKDNHGCFIGGLMLETFSAHPCAGVPTTVYGKDKTAGTEAGFFEWLLASHLRVEFEEKGRGELNWDELLQYSMPRLRRKIAQLHDLDLVTLSWNDLSACSIAEATGAIPTFLRMTSRYGERRLPVAALFLDTKELAKELTDWARARLEHLLECKPGDPRMETARRELTDAQELVDDLWKTYMSDQPFRVRRLWELAGQKSELTASEQTELAQLRKYFGATDITCAEAHCVTIWTLCGDRSPRAIRWAVLFMLVRLFAFKQAAVARYWKAAAKEGVELRPAYGVEKDDILMALFPVPANPAAIAAGDKKLERLKDDTRPSIFPLGKDDPNIGNLSIKLSEVLAGKEWNPSVEIARGSWKFGVMRFEWAILRAYAQEHGLFRSDGSQFLEGIFS